MSRLFDTDLGLRRVTRALPHWPRHDFIHQHTAQIMRDRVLDIKRDFATALAIGWQSHCVDDALRAAKHIVTCDHVSPGAMPDAILPVVPHHYDLVISHLVLQTVNDPALMLQQYLFALKPDGVFLGAVMGGESLFELRNILAEVEQDCYGGVSPRVHPFPAVQDMAGLMQQAGFSLPVVDSERITVTYADWPALVADLRGLGSANILTRRRKQPVGKTFWHQVAARYRDHYSDSRGRLMVTLEPVYLLGWAPHPSQPQPKARGSGLVHLGHALGP